MKYCGLVLLAVASLLLLGASDPLNPLVMRSALPSGAAPADCADGVSSVPLSPRVEIAEVPMPAEVPAAPGAASSSTAAAPPSGSLRESLRATQDALARNDRAAFDAALLDVKQRLDGFPRGGERSAAEELVRIWSDTARVWDAQFESPFFGEDSPLYATVNAYPGYGAAMKDRLLVDARGQKFYPADETRDFLSRLASTRLGGKSAPTPSQRRVPTKIRTEDEEEDPKTALPPVVKRRTSASTAPVQSKPAAAKSTPAPTRTAPPTPDPGTFTSTTTAANPPPDLFTSTTTTTDPLSEPSAVTATAAPPPATETSPQVVPETTTTAVVPEPAAKGSRFILPAVLILVGLGVLVLLFKTSN